MRQTEQWCAAIKERLIRVLNPHGENWVYAITLTVCPTPPICLTFCVNRPGAMIHASIVCSSLCFHHGNGDGVPEKKAINFKDINGERF